MVPSLLFFFYLPSSLSLFCLIPPPPSPLHSGYIIFSIPPVSLSLSSLSCSCAPTLISSLLPLCPFSPLLPLSLYPQLISSSCLICYPFQFNIFQPCGPPNVCTHVCTYTYIRISFLFLAFNLCVSFSGVGRALQSPPEHVLPLLNGKLTSWGQVDLSSPLSGIKLHLFSNVSDVNAGDVHLCVPAFFIHHQLVQSFQVKQTLQVQCLTHNLHYLSSASNRSASKAAHTELKVFAQTDMYLLMLKNQQVSDKHPLLIIPLIIPHYNDELHDHLH